jgi:hypothetical protein
MIDHQSLGTELLADAPVVAARKLGRQRAPQCPRAEPFSPAPGGTNEVSADSGLSRHSRNFFAFVIGEHLHLSETLRSDFGEGGQTLKGAFRTLVFDPD